MHLPARVEASFVTKRGAGKKRDARVDAAGPHPILRIFLVIPLHLLESHRREKCARERLYIARGLIKQRNFGGGETRVIPKKEPPVMVIDRETQLHRDATVNSWTKNARVILSASAQSSATLSFGSIDRTLLIIKSTNELVELINVLGLFNLYRDRARCFFVGPDLGLATRKETSPRPKQVETKSSCNAER